LASLFCRNGMKAQRWKIVTTFCIMDAVHRAMQEIAN
jgi:hypothetical protein